MQEVLLGYVSGRAEASLYKSDNDPTYSETSNETGKSTGRRHV